MGERKKIKNDYFENLFCKFILSSYNYNPLSFYLSHMFYKGCACENGDSDSRSILGRDSLGNVLFHLFSLLCLNSKSEWSL